MANFNAHMTGGIITSSLTASGLINLNIVSSNEVIALWMVGLVGGLMPDIDSDDSTSVRLIFKLFGIGVALALGAAFYDKLSIIGLWIVGSAAYCIVRFGVLPVFEQLTVHRGSIHSILSCVMFALASVCASFYAGSSAIFAYLAGFFMMVGMLTHLSLDELYSVDLSNLEIKRSFGTALKPLSLDYPLQSALQVLICAVAVYFAPPVEPITQALQEAQFNFLPVNEWELIKEWFN